MVPLDALGLVGVGVGEALDGAGVAAEETVEVGADLVALGLLEVVALLAAGLEEVGTLLGVTFERVSNRSSRVWVMRIGRLDVLFMEPAKVSSLEGTPKP